MPFAPFTAAEHTAIDEVLRHQRSFLPVPPIAPTTGERSELHIALDGHGLAEISRQLRPPQGGEMTEEMVAAAQSAIGCRIVHNHPTQGSLSASDWNVLANHPGMEMVAVNSRGTTFRGKTLKPDAFADWYAELAQAESYVSHRWEPAISEWYNQQNMDVADFANDNGWLTSMSIGERLAAKGFVEFEVVPAGSDAAALSDPRAAGIRQLLDQWCAIAIP
jgi:hypothetical protein